MRACVHLFSISVQCSRGRKERNVGVQQRRIIALARDLVEVTRHGPSQTVVASWASGPNRNASNKSLALVLGAEGAKRRSHTFMEEKTGGAVSWEGIWLHQSVDVCKSKAPNGSATSCQWTIRRHN